MSQYSNLYQFVVPDMPNGVEHGCMTLAHAFYSHHVYSNFETNQKLCSIRDKKELKQYYIQSKKAWTASYNWPLGFNKYMLRNFDQVLYALAKYWNVCKVSNGNQITWKFVTMHLANVPQIDSEKVFNHIGMINYKNEVSLYQANISYLQNIISNANILQNQINPITNDPYDADMIISDDDIMSISELNTDDAMSISELEEGEFDSPCSTKRCNGSNLMEMLAREAKKMRC